MCAEFNEAGIPAKFLISGIDKNKPDELELYENTSILQETGNSLSRISMTINSPLYATVAYCLRDTMKQV